MKNFIYSFFAAAAIMMTGCKDSGIHVTGVEVSPTAMTLEVGESRTLSLIITPSDADNRAVSWRSNNLSVATISDSGEVTAVGPGSATVTAITADGSRKATCAVNVVTVTGSGTVGGLTWKLTSDWILTISGEGAMPDFYSDDPSDPYNNYEEWRHYLGIMETVVINEGVTNIGDNAFGNYFDAKMSLKRIIIPNSVTSIGIHAFYYCVDLTSIDIPDSVTSIGDEAFSNCGGLTSIDIPESVTSIGGDAFAYCTSLASMDIPDGVTIIHDGTFSSCRSLTSIDLPAGVTSIGLSAFNNCGKLASLDIPDSVTSIGESAFRSCHTLTNIDIPAGVTRIENQTFNSCSNLKDVTIMNATPPFLGSDNFDADDDTLHVPQGSLADYENDPAWRAAFTNIVEQQ